MISGSRCAGSVCGCCYYYGGGGGVCVRVCAGAMATVCINGVWG